MGLNLCCTPVVELCSTGQIVSAINICFVSFCHPQAGLDPRQVGGGVMTPREQLRKMTALGEQGTLDEKHWYRLVNGMSTGGELYI